jgi:hypothetical protein
LMDTYMYMHPMGRLFFPQYIQSQDDLETFGFSIQYQPTTDHSSDPGTLRFVFFRHAQHQLEYAKRRRKV